MKGNKIITMNNILAVVITFLTTTFFPELLSSLLDFDINITIVAGFASAVTLLVLLLVKKIISQREIIYHQRLSNPQERLIAKGKFNRLRLYAISSRMWISIISQQANIYIGRCIILVKSKNLITKDGDRYDKELNDAINEWKRLVSEGKIGQLIIYEYNHIPDIFFAVFDDYALITGLNKFDANDSNEQSGDNSPAFFFSEDGGMSPVLIEKYTKHFDNYIEHYNKNSIFDNTRQ